MAKRGVSVSSRDDFRSVDNHKELKEPEDLMAAIRAELRSAIDYWNAHHGELNRFENNPSSLSVGLDSVSYNESQPLLPMRESMSIFRRIGQLCGRMGEFTQSWYFIAILLPLLAVPISYLFMGTVYFEECDYVKHFPIVFLLMGICTLYIVIVSVIRIVVVKVLEIEWFTLWWLCFFPLLLCSLLFMYQAVSFFSLEDIKPPGGNKTCSKVFYDFAWFNEFIAPSMMSILLWIL